MKSAADVVEYTDVDHATGSSFCSSYSIPPPTAGGLWSNGKGCAMCNYDGNCGGLIDFFWVFLVVGFSWGVSF